MCGRKVTTWRTASSGYQVYLVEIEADIVRNIYCNFPFRLMRGRSVIFESKWNREKHAAPVNMFFYPLAAFIYHDLYLEVDVNTETIPADKVELTVMLSAQKAEIKQQALLQFKEGDYYDGRLWIYRLEKPEIYMLPMDVGSEAIFAQLDATGKSPESKLITIGAYRELPKNSIIISAVSTTVVKQSQSDISDQKYPNNEKQKADVFYQHRILNPNIMPGFITFLTKDLPKFSVDMLVRYWEIEAEVAKKLQEKYTEKRILSGRWIYERGYAMLDITTIEAKLYDPCT